MTVNNNSCVGVSLLFDSRLSISTYIRVDKIEQEIWKCHLSPVNDV